MKYILNKILKLSLVTCLSIFPIIDTAKANCEVGPVLFRDTLFGAGIGLGVGALVLVANQNSNNIAANLATATLIGAGVGVVVGVVELSLSDCAQKQVKNAEEPGFKVKPILTLLPRQSFDYESKAKQNSFNNGLSLEQLNQVGMGMSLNYTFN